MTEVEKNKRKKVNLDNSVSSNVPIYSTDIAKSTGDGNSIFTEETESSMLTIIRNSKRENIFDGRIKLYYKDKVLNKKKELSASPRSMKFFNSKNRCPHICKSRYKLFKITIVIFGILLFLVSFGGVTFFLLLPKIAEVFIRNSDLTIKEIDILKISRQNVDPSFETNSVVSIGKLTAIGNIKFIHSLLGISYSIRNNGNSTIVRPLGELFISQVLKQNENGDYLATSRLSLTDDSSLETLIKYITSNIDDKQNDIEFDNNRNIIFFVKGLMSLKIFGIRVDNIIVEKTINYDNLGKVINDKNKAKTLSFNDFNKHILIHNKWLNFYDDNHVKINLEVELNISNSINANESKDDDKKINRDKTFIMPRITINNIGDLWFNVLLDNELLCQFIWLDFNIKSEKNIWMFSFDFPNKISDKLKGIIINSIINDSMNADTEITVIGSYSENEAFSEVIKKINIRLSFKRLLSMLESEIGLRLTNLNILDKIIRFVKIGGIEFINNSETLKMVGNIKIGYINPIGNSFPIIINNISLNSVIVDELENNNGNISLQINKKQASMRKLINRNNIDNNNNNNNNSAIKLFYENNNMSNNLGNIIEPKYEILKELSVNNKHINGIERCVNDKISKKNQLLIFKPCYNIHEFEMKLDFDPNDIKYEVKSEWIDNFIHKNRKLMLKDSSVNANITSIFGNSLFKNIKIKRNLLGSKNKIKFTPDNNLYIDDDDYNFNDYYKEDDSIESDSKDIQDFDFKNITKLININNIKILGEGYNNSWIIKITINDTSILTKLGFNKLEIGSLGLLISYDNINIGFIGNNDLKIGDNTQLTLFGVIKPEIDPTNNEVDQSLINLIDSFIKGNLSDIKNKNVTLEFKTNQQGRDMCIKYFNYTKYLSDEDINFWLNDRSLPISTKVDKYASIKQKNMFEKFLNGQKINIPINIFGDFNDFYIQKYIDNILDNNVDLISNSLCYIQSFLNEDVVINKDDNKMKINGIKEILTNKLKEYNIKISNVAFQILMINRESDLIIPINGILNISIPRVITKNLFINILYINYKLELYDKDNEERILSFNDIQNFNNINNEIFNNTGSIVSKIENSFDLNVKIENYVVKLEDQNDQLMNTIKTIFGLPKFQNEQVNNIELRSYIGIGIQASIGIIKLNDIKLNSTIRIPNCRKRSMKLEDKLNKQINLNSIFKVESIKVEKIRLIIPPRGIDIKLNTVINIPNYIDNVIFDIIIGQCVFELKNNDGNLLAIIKTPKQTIIGNNRKTESIYHGFIPAKSWLPIMNLLGSEENSTEKIHIKAINTPYGVPYWLIPLFDYYKLPASRTFGSLDSTEFGSITFS